MTKEFAEDLDKILKGGIENDGFFEFESDRFEARVLGDILERDGYGGWITGCEFQIYPAGYAFYNGRGGYTNESRKNEDKNKLIGLQINDLEYKKKIRKLEGIIVLWQVITAIIGIIGVVGWLLFVF